jgi:tetratricopeptide (TPR) repeat protein
MAHLGAGKWRETEEACRRLIPIWERRAAEQPGVPAYRFQLAQIHGFLGEALTQQRKWSEAEAALSRAAELSEALSQQNLRGWSVNQLSQYRSSLAVAQLMQGKRQPAEALFQRTNDAVNPDFRVVVQLQWAYGLALSGAVDDAVDAARAIAPESIRKASREDVGWSEYGLASTYAIAAAAVSDEAKSQQVLAEAFAHLRAAINDGWQDAEYLQDDPDWKPLQANEEFKQILAELLKAKTEAPPASEIPSAR